MNNKISKYQKIKKSLFSALVITTLGVSSINMSSVKADTLPSKAAKTKKLGKVASKTFVLEAGSENTKSDTMASIATPGTLKAKKAAKKKGKKAKTGSKTFVLEATPDTAQDTAGVIASSGANNVTAHYVDKTGKILAPNQVLTGKAGSKYNTTAQNISGYALTSKPANASGFFSDKPQNVTYVYEPSSIGFAGAGADAKDDGQAKSAGKNNHKLVKSNSSQTKQAQGKVNNQSVTYSATGVASSSKLPQTGSDKKEHGLLSGLGLLSIFGGLIGGALLSRKEKTR